MLRFIVSEILLFSFYLIKVGSLHLKMSECLNILLTIVNKAFDTSFGFSYHESIQHESTSSPLVPFIPWICHKSLLKTSVLTSLPTVPRDTLTVHFPLQNVLFPHKHSTTTLSIL